MPSLPKIHDNDGIFDVVEGGDGALDTNNDGVLDTNDENYLDLGGDGMSCSISKIKNYLSM